VPARCVQGLQPLTAAGGRKKNCPGGYCAFLHSTSVHSKVQGTGASMGVGCLPVPTGTSLGESMTRFFPLDAPLPPGSAGPCLGSRAAPQRGDKARDRLKGGRQRLGHVRGGAGAASCVAGAHKAAPATKSGPKDRSMGEGTRRVLRGTAQRGAVCRCGSRPLTAASWRRGQRTQRPACLDLTVLRQARKARRRVDMRTGMVVKAPKHLSQEPWAGFGSPEWV
jgi:hypothetical protein